MEENENFAEGQSSDQGFAPKNPDYYENPADLPEMQKAFADISRAIADDNEEIEIAQEVSEETPEEKSQDNVQASEEPLEQETEVSEKKYKKSPHRYRQEKNELIAQRTALKEENERLKRELQQKEYDAKYSHGKSVYHELEQAISLKKKALEDGDTDDIVKADIALLRAQRKADDLEEWVEQEKNQIERAEEPERGTQDQIVQQVVQQISYDWLKEHPDLNPASIHYQPAKAKEVAEFVKYLDGSLVENNLQHLYMTPEYFEQIEGFKQTLEEEPQPIPLAKGSPVAPVRNATSAVTSQKGTPVTISLSHNEKRMAQDMGVSEQEWLKYKIEQLKEERNNYAQSKY